MSNNDEYLKSIRSTVSVTLPVDLMARLEKYRDDHELTRTEVVELAINEYLDSKEELEDE